LPGHATVRGDFKTFEGSLTGTVTAAGTVDASIDTSSRATSIFFDVAQFANITFTSTEIKPTDDEFITGDLTMHGVTKPVTLRSRSAARRRPVGNTRVGLRSPAPWPRRLR
jgi:polyisoprenoid-binding protein YceI